MKTVFVVIILLMTLTATAQDNNKLAKENNETLKEAMALQNEGKLAQSNQKLTDLYALHFMSDYVSWQLASNYYRLGDYKRAERFAGEAMTDGSHYILQAGIIKSMCLEARQKYDEELQLLQNLAKIYPNEATAHFTLGMFQLGRNEPHKANAEFKKAVNLDKANPSMHLRIAYVNNQQQMYIHAFLAYYMYLFTNPVTYGKETIIAINEIMNRRNVNIIIDEKTADDSKLSKEDSDLIWAMLFLKELKTCTIDSESGLPDVDNFVDNSVKLLTSICESVGEKEGFYEEFYVDFYGKLLKDNMLEAFLYYCLIDTYPEIGSSITGMTREKMNSFADWLEDNFNN